jgi:MFS transporter, SP family, general alpha glucoside:H+ symporter
MFQEIKLAPDYDFNRSSHDTIPLRHLLVAPSPIIQHPANALTDFMSAYSTYYYETVFSTNESFALQVIQQVVSLLGNVCSWFIVDRVGRRNTQFYGLLLLTLVLMITAGLATNGTVGSLKGSCALIIFYCFAYK